MIQVHDQHINDIGDLLQDVRVLLAQSLSHPLHCHLIDEKRCADIIRRAGKAQDDLCAARKGYPNSDPAVPEAPGGARR